MDEQFDKKLSNHIKQVFDNYEHPGAEDGWAKLRTKFPAEEKGNKIAWLWWSSAAAVILVFFGVAFWYNNQDAAVNKMAVKPAAKQQQQPVLKDTAAEINPIAADKIQPVIANNNPTPTFNNTIVIPKYVDGTTSTSKPGNTDNTTQTIKPNSWIGHPQPWQTPSNTIAQTNPVKTETKPLIDSQKVANNLAKQPQLANTNTPADDKVVQATDGSTNSLTKQQPAKRSITDMFEADKLNPTGINKQAEKQTGKKVNFSIYAATYFNYAEGSTNQVNAGAGVTSDFRLSKNFKLSTGVSLAQNSLSYNTQAPPAAERLASAAPAARQSTLFATAAVLPVFKNYNANLVGLDIPINIKYEINPQKTDAYISAGLSSGTFINETYTYRYGYSGGAGFAANAAPEEQTAHNSFNSFYFAKTLNVSFGIGYPVGGNRLVIEPFVKYPLSGLGAQDIRFGAGGVNLKFSFKGRK
ncbi:hypothetical protein ABIB62_003433 [Mucilaginibacter sp. UYP25]|uniref:outer membrane beta-barrel protein n=1 Tax=unclassified Mucilaginibacter TaxID=2617802 RepID=UPI003390EDE5